MADYSWIGPLIAEGGKFINSNNTNSRANDEMQEAYRQMLANLQERFGDYDKLGKAGYADITAQQLGPSALESIPEDLQARAQQQEAIAALQQLQDNGGLSLADMAALNQIQSNLNRNVLARRKGLANDFAARGQLGSGAQLAMDLAGQQQAAESANQRGESVAAQAQARALQAILQKGQMARGMGQDDYARRADAARARDMIEARNAAARTDASKYNNTLRGQAFEDELAKARGKTQLTGDVNRAVFGRGGQSARTIAAQGSNTNALLDAGGSLFGRLAGSGGGSSGGGSTSTQGNTTTSDTPTTGMYDDPLGPEYRPEELEDDE